MGENTFKLSARRIASNFLYLSMAAIIGSALAYQARPLFHLYKVSDAPKPIFPINPTFFQGVNKIHIDNPLGQFSLKKQAADTGFAWRIDGANRLPAQETKVIDLLTAFSNLSIEKSYDLSLANAQNFLLDHPNMKLKLTDSTEEFQIRIGMTKVDERIAYVTVDGHPFIYKVRFNEFPFRNMIPQRFVESRPFHYELSQIEKLTLTKGRYSRVTVELTKSDDSWSDSKQKSISAAKVHQLIKQLENIKIEAIVDHMENPDEELKKYISSKSIYQMVLKSDSSEVTIKISKVVKSIPKLKMKSRGYYLLSSSDRKTPLIIGKAGLQAFKIKESQLHDLKVTDLIY